MGRPQRTTTKKNGEAAEIAVVDGTTKTAGGSMSPPPDPRAEQHPTQHSDSDGDDPGREIRQSSRDTEESDSEGQPKTPPVITNKKKK